MSDGLDQDEIDFQQNYCESSPSYYCDEHTCELRKFNYECKYKKNKEVDRKWQEQ